MKIRRIIVTSFRVMGSGSGYNWVVVFAAARVGVHVARTERLLKRPLLTNCDAGVLQLWQYHLRNI